MKKDNLIMGFTFLISGILLLVFIIFFDTKLNSILSGYAAAGIVIGGITLLGKYYYWTKPENINKYNEKIEAENINLRDERKEMLRDKSGRYAYILGLLVLFASIITFSILGALEIIENAVLIVIYLGGYTVFQYVIGIVIYRYLSKKY